MFGERTVGPQSKHGESVPLSLGLVPVIKLSKILVMPRMVTVLGLLQIGCVVLGFFALGIVLKVWGYPDNPMVRWAPLALFLRTEGGWLLVIPLLWMAYAARALAVDRGIFSARWAIGLGVGLPVVMAGLFVYASFLPCSRVLIIGH